MECLEIFLLSKNTIKHGLNVSLGFATFQVMNIHIQTSLDNNAGNDTKI
jgi:hypothetical protein